MKINTIKMKWIFTVLLFLAIHIHAPTAQANVHIDAGTTSSCLIDGNTKLWCWGSNAYGQLGIGNGINIPSLGDFLTPQAVNILTGVTQVSVGRYHACAIRNGELWCWGHNASGQLGNGTTANAYHPVAVTGLSSGVTAVSAGVTHTCAIVNGGAKCWGTNNYGQLGNGTFTNSTVPVDVHAMPANSHHTVLDISAGSDHTCAILSVQGGGQALCWGRNSYGQLGNNSTTNSNTFEYVVGANAGVTSISAGHHFTCFVQDGGVKCMGKNDKWQLGQGSGTPSTSLVPMSVSTLSSGVASMARTEGSLSEHACALKTNGAVYCWGARDYGQVGNGTTSTTPITPVYIFAISGGSSPSVGEDHTCALASSGAYCWGRGTNGRLGNGTTANKPSPYRVTGF